MRNASRLAAQLHRCQCSRIFSGRAFSTTSPWRRKGELASFPPTSSPELDAIVQTFWTNVFVPNHVGKGYRDMIYKPGQQYFLTGEEPVQARIRIRPATPGAPVPNEPAETPAAKPQDQPRVPQATAPPVNPRKKPEPPVETMLLNPLNRKADEPKTHPQYMKMLSLMQTRADFAIIPEFLRELRLAKRSIHASMLAKTVRRGSELQSLGRVIEMFRKIDYIGVSINHPFIVSEVVLAAVSLASQSGWSKKELDRVLRQVDMTINMAADSRHNVKWNTVEQKEGEALKLAYVWGTAMALEAVRSIRYGRRDFETGDERGLEARANRFAQLYAPSQLEVPSKWNAQNIWLAQWAPVYHGTRYALQTLDKDSDLALRLQDILKTLEPVVTELTQAVQTGEPERSYKRGLKMVEAMRVALTAEPVVEVNDIEEVNEADIEGSGQSEELFGASGATEEGHPDKPAAI